VSRDWRAYAHHILDAIEKIRRIQQRGDLTRDEVLYDATLRNLQTLSEATQRHPTNSRLPTGISRGRRSAASATFSCTTIWATSTQ